MQYMKFSKIEPK